LWGRKDRYFRPAVSTLRGRAPPLPPRFQRLWSLPLHFTILCKLLIKVWGWVGGGHGGHTIVAHRGQQCGKGPRLCKTEGTRGHDRQTETFHPLYDDVTYATERTNSVPIFYINCQNIEKYWFLKCSWIFFCKIPGPGKSWKITLVLESPGN